MRATLLDPYLALLRVGFTEPQAVTSRAVRSYRTISPLPVIAEARTGGMFSVALSLGLPPPDVIRLWCSDESGLSSLKRQSHNHLAYSINQI